MFVPYDTVFEKKVGETQFLVSQYAGDFLLSQSTTRFVISHDKGSAHVTLQLELNREEARELARRMLVFVEEADKEQQGMKKNLFVCGLPPALGGGDSGQ